MASLAAILGAWAALTLAGAALIHQRRWSSFLWVGSRPSFGQLGAGLAVGTVLGVALLFGYGWLENEPLLFPAFDAAYPLDQRVVYALSAVVALFVAALAEEVLFRGLVLQMTAAFTRRVAAICLINGLLFAAVHLYADPVVFLSLALSGAVGLGDAGAGRDRLRDRGPSGAQSVSGAVGRAVYAELECGAVGVSDPAGVRPDDGSGRRRRGQDAEGACRRRCRADRQAVRRFRAAWKLAAWVC